MLDKKKMKGTVKLGANNTCGGLVVTHKQGNYFLLFCFLIRISSAVCLLTNKFAFV